MTVEHGLEGRTSRTLPLGVVAGFDGSATSQLALDWAAETAAAYGAALTVVAARPDAEAEPTEVGVGSVEAAEILGQERADLLAAAVQQATERHPGIGVKALVHPESPVDALLEVSRSADMVVLGSRGIEGFRGLLLGSTTMNVAPHAHSTVVVVYHPDQTTEEAQRNARHPSDVVVGFDGSASARHALRVALRHAAATGLGVVVVIVTKGRGGSHAAQSVGPEDTDLSDDVRALLEQSAAVAAERPDVLVNWVHAVGRPAAVLIAEASGAPLGVVGARGRGGFKGLTMGSVGLQLLMHAECPVAVVHAPEEPAGH